MSIRCGYFGSFRDAVQRGALQRLYVYQDSNRVIPKENIQKALLTQSFFYWDANMDLLYERAKKFERLLGYTYKFTMGRRGQKYIFEVNFMPEDFHHLIGLKYLRDIECLNGDREKVFLKIINKEITYETISKSFHFTEIENRFNHFIYFADLFVDKNTIYRYTQDLSRSKIPADFLMMNDSFGDVLYVFVIKRKNEDYYVCDSFFPLDKLYYEKGQTKLTVLKVEETNINTKETNVIFLNSNYKE